jgi:hypothetical protein
VGPEDIEIESPCDADWDAMRATGTRRYCESCDHEVHDLSAMTEAEARRFLDRQRGSACVSYVIAPTGRVSFRAEAPLIPVTRLALGAAALGVLGALAACAPHSEVAEAIPDSDRIERARSTDVVIPTRQPSPAPTIHAPCDPDATSPATPPRSKRLKGKRVSSARLEERTTGLF